MKVQIYQNYQEKNLLHTFSILLTKMRQKVFMTMYIEGQLESIKTG
ncbi:hypothetical protein GN156_07120 [bacterium LRH843]|nr:hypothetical protein [bacterium LRH843]